MLISHRGFEVPMSHDLHDGFEIASSGGNHSAKVMAATVKYEVFRKTSLQPCLRKVFCNGTEVRNLGTPSPSREHPSFLLVTIFFVTAAAAQDFKDSVAHRYRSPSLQGLAVGNENIPIPPVDVLNSHPVKFSSIAHSGIAHQLDDVLEKLQALSSPSTLGSRRQQLFFRFVIQSLLSFIFFCALQFGSLANQLPFLSFVEHAAQCPHGAIEV